MHLAMCRSVARSLVVSREDCVFVLLAFCPLSNKRLYSINIGAVTIRCVYLCVCESLPPSPSAAAVPVCFLTLMAA